MYNIDLFPKIFKFEAIKDDWENIKNEIPRINFPKDWIIRESRKIIGPKHQFGFRKFYEILLLKN